MMEDRDFYGLAVLIGVLGLLGILQSRQIAQLYRDHMKVAADVAFLMDHAPVSHETEEPR